MEREKGEQVQLRPIQLVRTVGLNGETSEVNHRVRSRPRWRHSQGAKCCGSTFSYLLTLRMALVVRLVVCGNSNGQMRCSKKSLRVVPREISNTDVSVKIGLLLSITGVNCKRGSHIFNDQSLTSRYFSSRYKSHYNTHNSQCQLLSTSTS